MVAVAPQFLSKQKKKKKKKNYPSKHARIPTTEHPTRALIIANNGLKFLCAFVLCKILFFSHASKRASYLRTLFICYYH
jgi:hypothetical protein